MVNVSSCVCVYIYILGNEIRFYFFCFQEFESCFLFACPKFLSPAPPPSDATGDYDYVKEAIKHQTQVFMDEVRQQKMLPTIRRFTD